MDDIPSPPNTPLADGRWLAWTERSMRFAQGTPDVDKIYGFIGRADHKDWVGGVARPDDHRILAPLAAQEAGVSGQGLGTYLARTAAHNCPVRAVQVGRAWETEAPTGLLKFYHSRPLHGAPYDTKAIDRAIQQCAVDTLGMDPGRFELWGVVWPNTTPVEVYAYDSEEPMPAAVARALDGLDKDIFSIHRDGTRTWYAHCASHDRATCIQRIAKGCGTSIKKGAQARLESLEERGWKARLVAVKQSADGLLEPIVTLAREPMEGVAFRA